MEPLVGCDGVDVGVDVCAFAVAAWTHDLSERLDVLSGDMVPDPTWRPRWTRLD
jgi:hypothetical protein